MNIKPLSSKLILAGGIIQLILAIFHFVWPFSFIQTESFAVLNDQARDLVMLNCISVGASLGVFALLSFYFSRSIKTQSLAAVFFCLTEVIFWSVRLILELIFPVRIPVYFVAGPSIFIVAGAIFIITIYLIPFIFRKEMSDKNN